MGTFLLDAIFGGPSGFKTFGGVALPNQPAVPTGCIATNVLSVKFAANNAPPVFACIDVLTNPPIANYICLSTPVAVPVIGEAFLLSVRSTLA